MKSFFYIATPYRAHPQGPERAFEEACRFTARMIDLGLEVYSPIVHSHPVAQFVTAAPASSDFWFERQIPYLDACCGLIIAKMVGWDKSSGIGFERGFCFARNKETFALDPDFKKPPTDLLQAAGLSDRFTHNEVSYARSKLTV